MPLHTMPLCSFSYVGDVLSSATFKYDTTDEVFKSKERLFYKKSVYEIEKTNEKLFYKNSTVIDESEAVLLYKNDCKIDRHKEVSINAEFKDILIENLDKKLNSNDLRVHKTEIKNIGNIERDLITNLSKEFESTADIQINIKDSKQLSINDLRKLNKNILMNLGKEKDIEITRVIVKDIQRDNILQNININTNIFLDKSLLRGMSKAEEILFTDRIIDKGLDIINDGIQLDRLNQHNADKRIVNLFLYRHNVKSIDKSIENNFYEKIILRYMDKAEISEFYCRDNTKNLGNNLHTQLIYKDIEDLIKDKSMNFIYKVNIVPIAKINQSKLFYRDALTKINQFKNFYLNDISLIKLSKKAENINLTKETIINIMQSKTKALNDISINIYLNNNLYGLNKFAINTYNLNNLYGLNRFIEDIWKDKKSGLIKVSQDIITNIYDIRDLEVTNRWWILDSTNPTDSLILPFDYDYFNNPLPINARYKPYGYLIDQNNHPISFMPYLENSKGIDLNYGFNEIDLSIEIMLEMTNFVGMIVQHSASQFANCSGQEAIEFIMELLLNWLNMDTTIAEMNLKGSREHYIRAYRWIRWEAEKVWFMADKNHTQDRMKGIKYAGMLFAELIDYLKYHHFNIVPLWRNLKYMDIERQFNKQATNGDVMRELDKLKGKRHYVIETQNFERKNILGGK
ncbi:hypothetical protein [Clostridium sp. DJ247]|uniref:hypothetical protein n=1 Tax=Clostridium sp. DJ247 TaxID=2726188 RepID=UPI0016292C2E|nr:hypothetical protein [Clostridium sp. DJ247]MBC2580004.1 hypothetical protein [Clostridium sp. DJ247]